MNRGIVVPDRRLVLPPRGIVVPRRPPVPPRFRRSCSPPAVLFRNEATGAAVLFTDGAGGGSPPTVGQTSQGASGSASSIPSVGVNTAASGSCIVVPYCIASAGVFSSIADNKGNSANYVRIGAEFDNTFVKTGMFYCPNVVGGAGHTVTINITSGPVPMSVMFLEVLGASLTAPFDQTNHQEDGASPFTSLPTPTTTAANELLVGVYWGGSVNPIVPSISGATPASGWTLQGGTLIADGQNLNSGEMATCPVTAVGAYEAGFAESSSSSSPIWIATFK